MCLIKSAERVRLGGKVVGRGERVWEVGHERIEGVEVSLVLY